jgi:phosphonopyruvate decarboxylase
VGNTVNPLLSLASPKVYSIPMLLLIGWRGEPGKKDEPQHTLQGSVMCGMLKDMQVPFEVLPDFNEGVDAVLDIAYDYTARHKGPFALLVKKNTFEPYKPKGAFNDIISLNGPFDASMTADMLPREIILGHISQTFPSSPLVTTTGFCSRELFEMRVANGQGHDHDFLTVGSMGCCSSIALGIAVSRPEVETVCVDGDGAAIMHMGAFVTAGQSGAKNFKHILINNGMHDSVGGQLTGAASVDFCGVAKACGYTSATRVVGPAENIAAALEELKNKNDGPHFLEILSTPGARKDLGRPTNGPIENKDLFMAMMAAKGASA